ncbi:MAG: DNA polymerase III subunit gamma/tau [Patescibacteria group bacterium]
MFYRKYRPQKFSELDSEKIRETLGKAVLAGKFAQAYLLTGPKGIGKTSAARLIAKAINCLNRKAGEEPCNKCDSCKSIIEGRSLDVIEIDAASNTGVDDIRDLREKVKLATSGSKFKVYIIDEVHMLSTSAFNALLKTLEEPPAHVVFILATTDPQKLPETVVSRCQRFDFPPGTIAELTRAIERAVKREELRIDKEAVGGIAKLADGSFRDAHKLLEQLASHSAKLTLADLDVLKSIIRSEDLEEFTGLIKNKDRQGALKWVEGFVNKNGKIKELIVGVTEIFREELFRGEDRVEVLRRLEQAYGELRDTPIVQLPLELFIVEYCDNKAVTPVNTLFGEQWKELLARLKPVNHNLVAFMRAASPQSLEGSFLIIEVAYKFHLEKLSEDKNKRAIEREVSDIMGQPIRIKFQLRK